MNEVIRIKDEPIVRVSMAGMAQIEADGQQLLLQNYATLRATGSPVLTPIGGGIRVLPGGIEELNELIGITSEDLAGKKKRDLVFTTSGSNAIRAAEWFAKQVGRETDPSRELIEELAKQNKLIAQELAEAAQYSFAGFYAEFTMPRPGKTEKTLRLVEVSSAFLPPEAIVELRRWSQSPIDEGWVKFVYPHEIEGLKTSEGIEIGSVSRSVLHPTRRLPMFE